MSSLPAEILLDIYHCLERHEIEKSQLVSYHWNQLILRHLPSLPLHLLQNIKILSKHLYNTGYEGAVIYCDRLPKTIILPALKRDEILSKDDPNWMIMKSLKYCVFEQLIDKTTSVDEYEAIERAEQLCRISEEKLKVKEFLAFGFLKDTIFILENFVSASKAFVDTPIEQVLEIARDKSLWIPPTQIELSFSISLYESHFLSLLRILDQEGASGYKMNVRLNRYMNAPEFLGQVLDVYESCEEPSKKIRFIRFCNLSHSDLTETMIKGRNVTCRSFQVDRFNTIDKYTLELKDSIKFNITFLQKELDRGWIEYECVFEIDL